MGSDTYYQLLSLQPTASFDEIKKRYRQLSLRFHPDHGGSEHQMIKLNEAYKILSNPLTRREYDARMQPARSTPEQPTYTRRTATHAAQDGGRSPQFNYAHSRKEYGESTANPASQKVNRFWWWLSGGIVAALCFLIYEVTPVLQVSHQNINLGYTTRSHPSYPESTSLQPTATTAAQSSDMTGSSTSTQGAQPQTQEQASSSLSPAQGVSNSTLARRVYAELQQLKRHHRV